jgi:hypothetical protein
MRRKIYEVTKLMHDTTSKLEKFLYRKSCFDHGGVLHSNEQFNNVLAFHSQSLSKSVLDNIASSIEYRKHQKLWLALYTVNSKLQNNLKRSVDARKVKLNKRYVSGVGVVNFKEIDKIIKEQ